MDRDTNELFPAHESFFNVLYGSSSLQRCRVRIDVGGQPTYYEVGRTHVCHDREDAERFKFGDGYLVINHGSDRMGVVSHWETIQMCGGKTDIGNVLPDLSLPKDHPYPPPIVTDPPLLDSVGAGDPGAWALLDPKPTLANVIVTIGYRPRMDRTIFQWYTVVRPYTSVYGRRFDGMTMVHIPPEACADLIAEVRKNPEATPVHRRLAAMLPQDDNAAPFGASKNVHPETRDYMLRNPEYMIERNGLTDDYFYYYRDRATRQTKLEVIDRMMQEICFLNVGTYAMMNIATDASRERKMKVLGAYGHARIPKSIKKKALAKLRALDSPNERLRDAKADAAASIVSAVADEDKLVHSANLIVAKSMPAFDAAGALGDMFQGELSSCWE